MAENGGGEVLKGLDHKILAGRAGTLTGRGKENVLAGRGRREENILER